LRKPKSMPPTALPAGRLFGEVGEDEAFERLEGAAVLLAEVGLAQVAALLLQELRGDARDLPGGDFHARPLRAAVGPGLVEEAALAVGRGQEQEPAAGDGEHGPDGAVEVVGDAGRLVDDQHLHVSEAADGVAAAG